MGDGATEERDLVRVRQLIEHADDPFGRALDLHLTGSALVVHPPSRRVLLRWHERLGGWLQVGGHGDAGELDPFDVARREAEEETGLTDLTPWPADAPRPLHVVVVPVPATGVEPAHEHADVRYVLATARPEAAVAEKPSAPLRWVTLDEAISLANDNLAETLRRLAVIGAAAGGDGDGGA